MSGRDISPRLIALTVVVLAAFAANSLLNRAAVDGGHIDPSGFALIRVAAGAATLTLLVFLRGGGIRLWSPGRAKGALGLAAYMIGFSLAYLTLDAGLGALILFGTVQVGMFAWSWIAGQRPAPRALIGGVVAFAGLLIALWPGANAAFGLAGALFMLTAGIGWTVYTMAGRAVGDPLSETASNFIMALLPMCLLFLGPPMTAAPTGIALAVVSGAVTSGMGYALWYSVLPQLGATRAAVLQLSVPLIAIAAGYALLGETLTPKLLIAALLVVGGIGLAVTARQAPTDRS